MFDMLQQLPEKTVSLYQLTILNLFGIIRKNSIATGTMNL